MEKKVEAILKPGMEEEQLGRELRISGLKVQDTKGELMTFDQGTHSSSSDAIYFN